MVNYPRLAVEGEVEAVVVQKVVLAEGVVVEQQLVGAAQGRLGGVLGFHGAGELPDKTTAVVVEPLGHSVGEEAEFIPSQEAVEAADGDAASMLIGFTWTTAPGAGFSGFGAGFSGYGGSELDHLVLTFVDSMMGEETYFFTLY